MNKRKAKKARKKALQKPKLVVREPGFLGGYTCPACGERHCREPYCRNCHQRLAYDRDQLHEPPLFQSNEEWEAYSKKYSPFYRTK